jgi:two-component system response regulator GlrR
MEKAKPRILIADDEENILEAVSIVLKEAFDITTAARGDTALDAYRKNAFDLVISDVKMPGLDGIELFREVKAINPDQKYIFISVSSILHDDPEAREILDRRAEGFLGKPYRIPELLSLIDKVLQS